MTTFTPTRRSLMTTALGAAATAPLLATTQAAAAPMLAPLGIEPVLLTGRDKGRSGEVLKVLSAENRAIVQGINVAKRHQKQSQTQEGGIVSKELPVHMSNLAHEDPKDGKPTRVGFKVLKDGNKVCFARRSGEVIDG